MSLRILRTPAFILSSTITVAVAAAGVVAFDAWRAEDQRSGRSSRAFQRLTRGIGGGSAVDLSGCPRCFDPRLAGICPNRYSPQPGGDAFCAEHSVATFVWPSARRREDVGSHVESERVESEHVESEHVESEHVESEHVDAEHVDAERVDSGPFDLEAADASHR